MEFYGSKHPANCWLMPCKKRRSCRWNWRRLESQFRTTRTLHSVLPCRTSCVHLLKLPCMPSSVIALSSTYTRSTPLPWLYGSMAPTCLKNVLLVCGGDGFHMWPQEFRLLEKSKKPWPMRPRPMCSYLEITDWWSADLIAVQRKDFCVRSSDGLQLCPGDFQSPTPQCWR